MLEVIQLICHNIREDQYRLKEWVNHEWTRIFIPQDSWRLVKIRGSTLYCSEYSNATNIWGLTTNALRYTNGHEFIDMQQKGIVKVNSFVKISKNSWFY